MARGIWRHRHSAAEEGANNDWEMVRPLLPPPPPELCRVIEPVTRASFAQVDEGAPHSLDTANCMCVLCSPDHVQLVILNNEPLFFAARDGPWFPTLRILHKYPLMMVRLRVDTGAIKFVLSGANVMCPGLTSPGATIHTEVTASPGTCSPP